MTAEAACAQGPLASRLPGGIWLPPSACGQGFGVAGYRVGLSASMLFNVGRRGWSVGLATIRDCSPPTRFAHGGPLAANTFSRRRVIYYK